MSGVTGFARDAGQIGVMGRAGRIPEASKILAPFEGKLSGHERSFAGIASGPG
jgi:hypothetical protein